MSQVQQIIRDEQSVGRALVWAGEMIRKGLKGGDVLLTLGRPTRSQEQNRKMWAMLRDIARQVPLVINGREVRADPEDWKDVFTAALQQETRMAQGIDGSVVVLGMRTSKMSKAELSDLIELIYAYGAEQSVQWSAESRAAIDEHLEAG
jgi:thiamine monophosphate synthase